MNVKRELEYWQDTGKFKPYLTGKQIGRLIDLHNSSLKEGKEKSYDKEIEERNRYFLPLVRYALKHGAKAIYKSSSALFTKNPTMKGGENTNE